jgi:hypothetical protein
MIRPERLRADYQWYFIKIMITALQSPDGVFKSGAVVITGLKCYCSYRLHGEWVVFHLSPALISL